MVCLWYSPKDKMRILVVISVLIAVAASEPEAGHSVAVKQDTLGNYNIQYAIDSISRVEQRTVDGHVHGGFSYIDPHGVIRKTIYNSGQNGFHAVSSDIPIPVQDTPEVALAKAQHLTLLRGAHLANGHAAIPETRFALPVDYKLVKDAATSTVSWQSIPVAQTRIETDVPVVKPHHLTLQSVPIETQLPAVRTTNFAINTIPVSERLEDATELLRSGQLTFESVPEKVVKTEIPVYRTNNIAVESIPLTEKFIQTPLLKSSQVALAENIVKTEIPVFRTASLELKSLPLAEQFIKTNIPLVRSGEISLSQARYAIPERRVIETEIPIKSHFTIANIASPKSRLEIPSHQVFEIPRSSIALDPVRVLSLSDGTQIRLDNDNFRNILIQQK